MTALMSKASYFFSMVKTELYQMVTSNSVEGVLNFNLILKLA